MSEVKTDVKGARVVKLGPMRFQADEFARTVWNARPESSVQPDQLLDPMYWAHVAGRLRPYSEIVVIPEGGAYYMRLLVTSVSKVEAVVTCLEFKDLRSPIRTVSAVEQEMGDAASAYEIKYVNPSVKFRVIRKADKAVLKDSLENESVAREWLATHLKGK